MLGMNSDLPFVKCAAPECISRARFGNACTDHSGSMYDSAPWRQQSYVVVAVDPEREHVAVEVPVRASSEHAAKRAALAREKKDDWSIRYVMAAA